MLKIFLGFNFYGAGNIGDDLMLAGFLELMKNGTDHRFVCDIPAEFIPSQRARFPQIQWVSLSSSEREKEIQQSDIWLGVGGTPFQLSSGGWFLKRVQEDYVRAPQVPKWMFCVGCEREVLSERPVVRDILKETALIWTRDSESAGILSDCQSGAGVEIRLGGDLAHAYFASRSNEPRSVRCLKENGLGLILYGDPTNPIDRRFLRSYAGDAMARREVTFLANDVRRSRGMEFSIYRSAFIHRLAVWRRKPRWFAPDYSTADVSQLTTHLQQFETVLSSRYHGLVAAAWSGCKVGAVVRGSKIDALAKELGVPRARLPMSVSEMLQLEQEAARVERGRLENLAQASLKALSELKVELEKLHETIGAVKKIA